MTFVRSLAVVCLCCAFGAAPAFAKGVDSEAARVVVPDLPNAPSPQPSAEVAMYSSSRQEPGQQNNQAKPEEQKEQSSADQLKSEEKQRMLGVVPSFNVVLNGEAKPLSSKQKFDLWFHSAVDPFTFLTAGIDAGIEQGQNEYPAYGQGFTGFAKRYGASYADAIDGNFWGNAVLPSLLHQDPRYFRVGHGSFGKRTLLVVLSTIRCKGDNGRWQPSWSNIGGNFIGGAIANLYYPASERGVGLTLERGLTVTAEGAIGAFAFEFYPDAIKYLKRRHHQH